MQVNRWTRLAAAAGLTTVVAFGGVAGSGVAAAAATPVILGSCATTVTGAPGTPLELSPAAVVAPITNLVEAVPILGPALAPGFQSAFNALPPIPLGALPTGSGTITGAQVADAVVAQLNNIPLLGPIINTLVVSVRNTLSGMCQVFVTGVNNATGAVQDGTAAVASASQQAQQQAGLLPKSGGSGSGGSGSGGSSGGTGSGAGSGGAASQIPPSNSTPLGGLSQSFGSDSWPSQLLGIGTTESPLDRYAGIPFATAGLFAPSPGVRYGGDVPGYSPGYGVLGPQSNGNSDDVQTAGHATALGGLGSLPGGVGLPMLLAVLALSGVTAALVRTWVLRRMPA